MKPLAFVAAAAMLAAASGSAFAHGMPERVFKEHKSVRSETPAPSPDAPSSNCEAPSCRAADDAPAQPAD
ncbi:hypothetical protein [Burkholderia sp. TSV86]|uniref:hypothetical protein n=1 Tax=Burkholderia sp. TSV86 TaxID=1385594 RepID=UPI00075F4C9B|nr:hypothetical protein [Burkholderia sp. TSV86]KVE32696.1 hypothetical protein WS68_16375 [Burkholderia sp. TSV86]